MSAASLGDDAWTETDYRAAWAPFEARFAFEPDYHERERPAIRLPADALVLDLDPIFAGGAARFAAGESAVNAAATRAFVWLGVDEHVTALDWQHPAYHWSPARHALSGDPMRVPVFPNGDYYVHAAADLRWGTFGHPWQRTLCLWGAELTDSLGAELLTWLPRHRHSLT